MDGRTSGDCRVCHRGGEAVAWKGEKEENISL